MKILKGNEIHTTDDPLRHLFYGSSGVGKSRMITTSVFWLAQQGIPPEARKIIVVDFDRGIKTNFKLIPDKFIDSFILIEDIDNFDEIKELGKFIRDEVKDHIEKHGVRPIVAVDNIESLWDTIQQLYTRDVYNISMAEKKLIAQKTIKAKEMGLTDETDTLTLADWNVMKTMMQEIRNTIYNCGADIIITTTAKEMVEMTQGAIDIIGIHPSAEKHDRKGHPFHFISYLYIEPKTQLIQTATYEEGMKGMRRKKTETVVAEAEWTYHMILLKNRLMPTVKHFQGDEIRFDKYMDFIKKLEKKAIKLGLKAIPTFEESDSIIAEIEKKRKEAEEIMGDLTTSDNSAENSSSSNNGEQQENNEVSNEIDL